MPAGRKPAFSRDEFIRAALTIADEKGVSALSIRSLAATKGVTSATIYRYFEDKEDIVASARRMLLSELPLDNPTSGPRENLLTLAIAFRSQVRAHPCLAEFTAMPSTDGSMTEVNAFIIEQLRQLGLSGSELVRGFRQLESFVVGVSLFDFSSSPNHLKHRLLRIQKMNDPDFSTLLHTPEDVDRDNEIAFQTSLVWLIDMLTHQVASNQ